MGKFYIPSARSLTRHEDALPGCCACHPEIRRCSFYLQIINLAPQAYRDSIDAMPPNSVIYFGVCSGENALRQTANGAYTCK